MQHISTHLAFAGRPERHSVLRQAIMVAALVGCTVPPSATLLAAEAQAGQKAVSANQEEFLSKFMAYYVKWAEEIEARGQATGTPLDPDQVRLAAEIGIKHPEKVRLVFVDEIPFPTENPEIKLAGETFGFIGPGIVNNAQAFGYTIWVRKGFTLDQPRLAHELVHVWQIERSTSFAAYAGQYVSELIEYGHDKSPLELEAYDANQRYAG